MEGLEDLDLNEREKKIAHLAAKLAIREIVQQKIAVKEVTSEFYQQVGRGLVTRVLVWIGAAVVGYAVAKGWVRF